MNFTAIDFETAHPKRWSICQIGLVRVEDGVITKCINQLIRPPDNLYWDRFTEIHGLDWESTYAEPSFNKVWESIRPFIEGQTVVAHNGAFDFSCLRQVWDYYQIESVTYTAACTYKLYKKKLNLLCAEHDIPLNHHDALSDAKACAELYRKWLYKG